MTSRDKKWLGVGNWLKRNHPGMNREERRAFIRHNKIELNQAIRDKEKNK